MTNWYQHPLLPYEVSTDLEVRRIPGKGSPRGRLLRRRSTYHLSHEGRVYKKSGRDLLNECVATHVTPTIEEVWGRSPRSQSIEVSNLGNARWATTHHPIKPFFFRGFQCVRAGRGTTAWTLHNLVADAHLPNKPPDATYAYFLTSDRENCAVTNLTWTKPTAVIPDADQPKKRSRPLTPAQLWAIQYNRRRT